MIADWLGQIGLEVRIKQAPSAESYYRQVETGDYDLDLSGWIADGADPADFLDVLLASRCIPSQHKNLAYCSNNSRYASPEMDRAIENLRREGTADARKKVLDLVGREVPLLPLMYGPTIVVHSWRVKGYRSSPFGRTSFVQLDLGS